VVRARWDKRICRENPKEVPKKGMNREKTAIISPRTKKVKVEKRRRRRDKGNGWEKN